MIFTEHGFLNSYQRTETKFIYYCERNGGWIFLQIINEWFGVWWRNFFKLFVV